MKGHGPAQLAVGFHKKMLGDIAKILVANGHVVPLVMKAQDAQGGVVVFINGQKDFTVSIGLFKQENAIKNTLVF